MNDDTSNLPQEGTHYDVPQQSMPADLDLQSGKDDALQEAAGDETPSEILNIPEHEVKKGFDQIAFDDRLHNPEDAEASDVTDDWREYVEERDESATTG